MISAQRRLKKEYEEILLNCPDGISCAPYDDENLFHWWALIEGPRNSPYEGGNFGLDINFPQDYPFQPPQIVFKTRIFHPNISKKGIISIDILEERWAIHFFIDKSNKIILLKLLLAIQSFLDDPNPDNSLEPEIAYIYKTDRNKYQQMAKKFTEKYAK